MTCDDCYFSELCLTRIDFGMGLDSLGNLDEQIEKSCKHFKNKNLIIELPCKVGDTVYQICRFHEGDRILESKIMRVIFDTNNFAFDERAIGKTVFLNREDAERALRECYP